ncbi:hypothetical protein [Kutzneria sp. CA-103260]|uniref:hypothetical protein n=1 Tax=Kutzneria sp. CA-103260 TaxID=2802641 RepID=UPI001BEF95B4|nr:hypothetical protein [Kutzneria sp. CA-103260]QUQ63318.1 hypothetical protein JJ691_10300 [Kutzneria sp. CA-103260]
MTQESQPDSTGQSPSTPPTGDLAQQDPGAAASQAQVPPQGPVAQPGQFPQQAPMPPQPYVQQPWSAPAPGFSGAPRPAGPATGPGLAVVSLLLGLVGSVVWLLPINLDPGRHYLPIPFGVGGLVLGIVGLVGNRKGKPTAAVGVILSVIALILGILMTGLEVMHSAG